jgi:hypothetical protein
LEKRNEKRESEGKIIPQFEGGFSFINYTKSLHMWKLKKNLLENDFGGLGQILLICIIISNTKYINLNIL